MNRTPISKPAANLREAAREKTGEFGTQGHADSGLVDVETPFPYRLKAVREWFQTPKKAFLTDSANAVTKFARRADCDFNEFDIGTWDWEIAIDQLHDQAVAQVEETEAAGQDITWEAAAAHLERVAREANRRHVADTECLRLTYGRGLPHDLPEAFVAILEGLDDIENAGLLPPGTSASVTCGVEDSPFAEVLLTGMPDRLAKTTRTDTHGDQIIALSRYGGHVDSTLRFAASRYRSREVSYFVKVDIESDEARDLRVASLASHRRTACRTSPASPEPVGWVGVGE
jgi:hypothetical protein